MPVKKTGRNTRLPDRRFPAFLSIRSLFLRSAFLSPQGFGLPFSFFSFSLISLHILFLSADIISVCMYHICLHILYPSASSQSITCTIFSCLFQVRQMYHNYLLFRICPQVSYSSAGSGSVRMYQICLHHVYHLFRFYIICFASISPVSLLYQLFRFYVICFVFISSVSSVHYPGFSSFFHRSVFPVFVYLVSIRLSAGLAAEF